MLAALLILPVLLAGALADQPTSPADGPLQTAPKERPVAEDPIPGLDDKAVEIAPDAVPEPVAKPAVEDKPVVEANAPAPDAAPKSLSIAQKTVVQGETLQVVLGQRALFRLDDKGLPVLDKVEEGKLAAAHLEGAVTETFEAPPEGQIAIALDGSAEVRATILKVWNQTDKPLDYRAIALVLNQGKVTPTPAPVCAVPAGEVRTETWRRPVVAVGLGRFKAAAPTNDCK